MRNLNRSFGQTTTVILIVFALALASAAQQKPRGTTLERKFELGSGMGLMTGDLMQVAARSDVFLQFADEIKLTVEQLKKLEDIYFQVQKYSFRRQMDSDVAEAELRRLLSNDSVDLSAVREKVKEVEAIRSDVTIKNIKAALEAIGILTHEQHLKVMLLVSRPAEKQLQPSPLG